MFDEGGATQRDFKRAAPNELKHGTSKTMSGAHNGVVAAWGARHAPFGEHN